MGNYGRVWRYVYVCDMIRGAESIPEIWGNIWQMKTKEWAGPFGREKSKSSWVGIKWGCYKWCETWPGWFGNGPEQNGLESCVRQYGFYSEEPDKAF